MLGQIVGTLQDGYFESGKLRIIVKDAIPEVYLDGVLVEDGYNIRLHMTSAGIEFSYTFEE